MRSNRRTDGSPIDELFRRRFLQATIAGGGLVGVSGSSRAQRADFELDARTTGWRGRAPPEIDGETNPTLALREGRGYTLVWTNADGVAHDFVVEDDAGESLVETETVAEEGATRTVSFTATEEMAEYYCSFHPSSMRGPIDVGDGEPDADDRPELDARLEGAEFVTSRHFDSRNYERILTHRKKEAIRALLSDPAVNGIVSDWAMGFEAYEPLTNHVETVSLQGTSDLRIERDGFEDPDGGATFEVTATRQVVYGLVDRRTNDVLALQITDPREISWTEEQDEEEARIGRTIHEHPDVGDHVGEKDWFPVFKGATGSITGLGMADLPHGEGGTAVLYVDEGDDVSIVSVFVDGSDPDDPEIVNVDVVERAVREPPRELARTVAPRSESVLESTPDIPVEKRPLFTGNDGFHRIEPPEESFERHGWQIEWSPTRWQGITVTARYRDTPVFEAMNNPITYTGYYLPPRDGRSTLEWYFPGGDSVFGGDLLFWDVHGPDAGGPGLLGRVDAPERTGKPDGFALTTHYHTGAEGRESIDFHSGARFGPYNYEMDYEFYEDGVLRTVWQRNGPGFVQQFLERFREGFDYANGGDTAPVVQHYTATTALDVTPGTRDGVEVRLFDGDGWTTPETEFYERGRPGTTVRFGNLEGPETIDVPLDDDTEIVVVARDGDEIGPGEVPAHRLEDEAAESSLYHPAQYVDGEAIQGERVIVWLLMEAATDEMPYYAGNTVFATSGELRLSGY